MASTRIAILAVALAACSGSKNNGGNNPDGNNGGQHDARVDAPVVPATITIMGTATSRSINGTAPVQGATIGAYQSSNPSTAVTTTTTDAQGNFTLTVMTNGASLDGFLKATLSGYTDSYLYPPAPITMNEMMIPVNMVTTGNFGFLSTLAQGNQQPGNGLVAVLLHDTSMMPVAGGTISSTPASNPYRYNGSNGLPSSQATSTGADGIGYMFNAPSTGTVMVSATKTGVTFKSHVITAWPDALTTTEITE